ncbi:hypothetical protein GG804_27090 [Sphingomonas histidinilytica]|uniref:hypothetical protein n=1 Tax=Rhizorhabdus histidinilytica TaxID=439228 RepID=UPI001ADC08B8|nr:hypothetical protein [Rhizorhabdus histidinilytica]MBO9380434.1 hypothetical protein [Rhizorhabdus histidinilytica]
MTGGSQQLRAYRRYRADGFDTKQAAAFAGISLGEAQLIDKDDARDPPPPEAFEPIPALAGPASTTSEEPAMARRKKQTGTVNGEVPKPDFEMAVKIYREDIRPAQGTVGEAAQEMSTAYKAIKKQAHIQPQAARLAFRLDAMEESKRDDYLRCFRGLLKELKIFMPSDLVDAAQGNGDAGGEVIPIGERRPPQLATVPRDDSDLAGGGDVPNASADDAEAWVVFDPEASLYIDPTGKDWAAFADCGRFTRARAQEIIDSFGEDADGLQIVDSAGPLPGPMVSEAAE